MTEPQKQDAAPAETAPPAKPEATAEPKQPAADSLPEDHPLVRTLAAQKDEIKALKAKAQKLDEIEDAQKTQAQKDADRIAELESKVAETTVAALRFKVASKFGINDEDADLFLTGSDEETITKQAERLAAKQEDAGKPRAPKPDPNQGRSSSGSPSTADQFAASVSGLL